MSEDPVPKPMESPARERWFAKDVLRIILVAGTVALLLSMEGKRADSPIPIWDDQLLLLLANDFYDKGGGDLEMESRPDPDTRVLAPSIPGSLPVVYLEFQKSEAEALNQWPPSQIDLAVTLSNLAKSEAMGIGYSQPFLPSPQDGTLALKAMASSMDALGPIPLVPSFEPGFAVTANDEALAFFQDLPSFESGRVLGDISALPEVNDPGSAAIGQMSPGKNNMAYASLLLPERMSPVPGRIAFPLLARTTNNRVLPSLPLLLWLKGSGIALETVEVKLGEGLLVNEKFVPCDLQGYLHLPIKTLDLIESHSPLDLGLESGDSPPAISSFKGKYVLIGREGVNRQGVRSNAAVTGLLESGKFSHPALVLRRANPRGPWLVTLVFAMGALLSLSLPRWSRVLVGLVFVLYFAGAIINALHVHQLFMEIVFPLTAGIAAFITACWVKHQKP